MWALAVKHKADNSSLTYGSGRMEFYKIRVFSAIGDKSSPHKLAVESVGASGLESALLTPLMLVEKQIAGFVLAGGKSSRMGSDKASLEIAGASLIARAVRLLESVTGNPTIIASRSRYSSLGALVVADDWPDSGPLGGIATVLRESKAPPNLIIACVLLYPPP